MLNPETIAAIHKYARAAARRHGLPDDTIDDIAQEASLQTLIRLESDYDPTRDPDSDPQRFARYIASKEAHRHALKLRRDRGHLLTNRGDLS